MTASQADRRPHAPLSTDSAPSPTDPACSTCGGAFDSPPCSLNRDIGWSGHTVAGGVGAADALGGDT